MSHIYFPEGKSRLWLIFYFPQVMLLTNQVPRLVSSQCSLTELNEVNAGRGPREPVAAPAAPPYAAGHMVILARHAR